MGTGQQMFRLQMSVDADVVDVGLVQFKAHLTDLREFFAVYAAPKLYRDIQDNFDSQGEAVGRWVPLSRSYAAWKAEHYPGRNIMVLSGALKTSLTFEDGKPGTDGVFNAQRNALIFGTKINYARHHQRPEKSGRPPMRRLLFLMRNASDTLGRLLHQYGVDQAKKAGLRTRESIRARSAA